MQLRFGPDDEDRFFARRDELIERFGSWLLDRGQEEQLSVDAELFLQFKWGYLDGDLGRWTLADLDEMLLELYPRKVIADAELSRTTIPAMRAWLAFLDDQGLADATSSPLRRLEQHLDALEEPFRAAMDDTSQAGLGTSLIGSMMADGVQPTDEEAVATWIEGFNAGATHQRDQAVGPALARMLDVVPAPRLRPVRLAPNEELERAARAAPAMVRFEGFVDYVSSARKLTTKGNLRLADARELVERLETGDAVDEEIGDRTFKTSSSTELSVLDLTYRWARQAGLVKVRKGELSTTKKGRQLTAAPLETVHRALVGFLELGPTSHHYRGDGYGFGWYADDLDGEISRWLVELYQHGPAAIDELVAELWGLLLDRFALDGVEASKLEFHRSLVDRATRRAFFRLGELGLVEVTEATKVDTLPDHIEVRGGTVTLTDLGRYAVNRLASAHVDAPVVGAHVDDDAATLLRHCADLGGEIASAELDAWVAHREPGAAAEELVASLPTADDVAVGLGFATLLRLGKPAAPAVRSLADDPRLSPYATVWRLDASDVAAEDVVVDDPEGQVRLLHAVLELRGVHAIDAWLPVVLGVGSAAGAKPIADAVGELWRVRTAAAGEVLDAVASVHPDKVVAKAARKALFKLRSATS